MTDLFDIVLLSLSSSVSCVLRPLSHLRTAGQCTGSSILERRPPCTLVVLVCPIRLLLRDCHSHSQHNRDVAAAFFLVCSWQHVSCPPALWSSGHSAVIRHLTNSKLPACGIRFCRRLRGGHVSLFSPRIYREHFKRLLPICADRIKLVNSYATLSSLTAELDGVTFGLNIIFPIGNLFVRYSKIYTPPFIYLY